MKNTLLFILLMFFFCRNGLAAEKRPYWIFFTDRGDINVEREIAAKIASSTEPKNSSRRARVFRSEQVFNETDVKVNPEYIAAVTEISGSLRTVTRFLNGVSVELDEEGLKRVKIMPFVREVRPLKVFRESIEPEPVELMRPGREEKETEYGNSFDQLNMIDIIKMHKLGYMGSGILIAVLDSGFDNLEHAAFDSARIVDMWDFVDNDNNPVGDNHGTEVLSVIAALDQGTMIGAAPYATYLLARTEIVVNNKEIRAEEDNWVKAIEWADSLGTDIVNSSLGYTTFDDGSGYTYSDLDGDTAVTTIAADAAAAKGMIIVNSAGNEGNTSWYYVTTPADGDSVLAIGSVNRDTIVSQFSSRGPTFDGRIKPDFVALGENVWIVNTSGHNTYKFASGTSFATPAVSGAVALLLEVHPLWDFDKLKDELISGAHNARADSLYGYGIVDTFAASGLEQPAPVATRFSVYDPYPQPITFSETNRWIYFPVSIPVEGRTLIIKIFNFTGENIQTLESPVTRSGLLRDPGYAPSWDGTNFSGEHVAPGIYFYSIRLFGYDTYTGKIMVMR